MVIFIIVHDAFEMWGTGHSISMGLLKLKPEFRQQGKKQKESRLGSIMVIK